MADKTEVQRFLGPERLAEQHIAGRPSPAGQSRQDQRTRRLGDQPQVHERHQETSAFLGNDQVAVEQHGRADANRIAVDGRDDGHLVLRQRPEQPPDGNVRSVPGKLGHEIAEVVAGGEVLALAFDRNQPNCGIIGRIFNGACQRGIHGNRDGIAAFWSG